MAHLPCKNPNCKSYGKPHPNCQCYGEMAEGGAAGFCSGARNHDRNCKYFVDGGFVSGQEVPADDLPDAPAPDPMEVPADDLPDEPTPVPLDDMPGTGIDEANADMEPADLQAKLVDAANPEKKDHHGNAAAAVVQGIAQGIAGPIAPLVATKVLDIPAEKLVANQEEHPIAYPVGELIGVVAGSRLGVGSPAAAEQAAATLAAKIAGGSKIGSKLIAGSVSTGLLQGSDEVSKWILGQGDPVDAVGAALAHMSVAAFAGAGAGIASELAGRGFTKALEKIGEAKIGERIEAFLYGVGSAAKDHVPMTPEELKMLSKPAAKSYEAGKKYVSGMAKYLVPPTVGASAEGWHGFKENGVEGAMEGVGMGVLHGIAGSLVGYGMNKVNAKIVAPTILRALSTGRASGLGGALDYAAAMASGDRALNLGVQGLMQTPKVAQQAVNVGASEKNRKKFMEWLEGGAVNTELLDALRGQGDEPQGFAKGGEAKLKTEGVPHHQGLMHHFPEQNIMINTAKGRIASYLGSLKPQQNAPRLAFDDEPDNTEAHKTYNKAVDIAMSPLSVLHEVKNGTIEPEHVKHFNALHPEVNGLLQKKLAQEVVEAQISGKKPSFKVRQGLSMLMGAPLSGEFTPTGIQAAQATFAAKNQKEQKAAPKQKSETKALSKSDAAFLTDDQARMKRAQKA